MVTSSTTVPTPFTNHRKKKLGKYIGNLVQLLTSSTEKVIMLNLRKTVWWHRTKYIFLKVFLKMVFREYGISTHYLFSKIKCEYFARRPYSIRNLLKKKSFESLFNPHAKDYYLKCIQISRTTDRIIGKLLMITSIAGCTPPAKRNKGA